MSDSSVRRYWNISNRWNAELVTRRLRNISMKNDCIRDRFSTFYRDVQIDSQPQNRNKRNFGSNQNTEFQYKSVDDGGFL